MRHKVGTLAQYANRRFMLAGGRLLSGNNPFCIPIDALRAAVEARGQRFLSLAHYDYLGLANDERVRTAAAAALDEHGNGPGASRLVGGERSIHRELETDLASFVGTEDALAMISGYATNASLVGHILTSGDLILHDDYAHNSIMAGTKMSRADCVAFEHNNLDQLEAILRVKRGVYGRVLVIVEGMYSMDGDIPDLPRLLAICRRHGAWLMIDEAHSIGVLGATGRGITEHFGIDPREIDLIIGTMSKAFVSSGGFICASSSVVNWLRYTLPGFVYSVGLPPQTAASVRAAIATLRAEPERVERLRSISRYFVETATAHGFEVGTAIGAGVVPVYLPTPIATMAASEALMDAGIYVPPIVQAGVPKDLPRLRFFFSASHTREDVDRAIGALASWAANWQEPAADDDNVIAFAS